MRATDLKKKAELKTAKAFWIWLAGVFLMISLLSILMTAGLVRHAMSGGARFSENQTRFILTVAEFPSLVKAALVELWEGSSSHPLVFLMDTKATEKPHWLRRFPAPEDSGYLLFSGVDPLVKRWSILLIRISDGKEVARWDPDWRAIYEKITEKKWHPKGALKNMAAVHPLLLQDGDIIFNTGNSMVRMNSCGSKPLWVLDDLMHHSNEIDQNGDIWTPSVAPDYFIDNPYLHTHLRDDALARISGNGHIIERQSFSKILIDNGFRAMLLGTLGSVAGAYGSPLDPIHLNQISIAPSDSEYWKRGDLLISARHLSSIFLYRPSTGKIIWHQQGPWMNQHAAMFVDSHRISVFDNNVIAVAGGPLQNSFVTPGEINRVFVYDYRTRQATQPFEALLAHAKPVINSHGRAQILPDGGLFIEETNHGRHLRFLKDRLLWSRVNDYDKERIGLVRWSRYLTAEEVKKPLLVLSSKPCQKAADRKR